MQDEPTEPAGPGDSSSQSLAIEAPSESPNDEPIPVRVVGASPGRTVEFEASLTDADGLEWSARATLPADEDGVVDLTERLPESGTYDGVEPMGWLWSMRSDAEAPFANLGARLDVTLRAETTEKTAKRTITRVRFDDDLAERGFELGRLAGTLYVPSGEGPHPAVVELHGSGGRRSDDGPRRLATRGYATLAIEYFGDSESLPDDLERIPLSRFDTAVAWLRDQPDVAADRVGLVGSSRGGELALLLGAHREWVGAVVSYAGSIPWDTPSDAPAWLLEGEPLPHLVAEGSPAETDLEALSLDHAVPPIERTDGPILLLSGGADRVWPARRLSERLVERLERRGFAHAYDHRSYDGVGHLIGAPYEPLSGIDETDPMGGTASQTARAGADSWPLVLESLSAGLERD